MPNHMDSVVKADSLENLKGLRISSLDDDGDGDEEQEEIVFEEDDEEDEDEEDVEPVTLGFVEKPKNHWSLHRQLFPSKAGGVPAWLDPVNLPSGSSCVCDTCGEPLKFLLQVYAPISEKESTFHRTLFVFMCPSMSCLFRYQHEQWKRRPEEQSRSVKVFRCQLPRLNPFYSSEPPRNNGSDKPSGSGVALCNWCGTWKGDKVCSSCKKARYCSQKHQVIHWGSGHKFDCQRLSLSSYVPGSSSHNGSANAIKAASDNIWPEYEVINEDESEFDAEMSDEETYANSLVSRSKMDNTMKSLLDSFEGDSEKKCFASFEEHIAKAPEQVLRYCRNPKAKVLWPLSSGRPSKADIPNCSYCGGPLNFELQILPQLLYYFGVRNDEDSLDWATIVLYTCAASCEASVSYKEEFAWVQLYTPTVTACC